MNVSDDSILDATMRAKVAAGGPSALSRALGETGETVSPQAISKWERVPAERVLEVEAASGISRYDLRPDVFGPKPNDAESHKAEHTGAAA